MSSTLSFVFTVKCYHCFLTIQTEEGKYETLKSHDYSLYSAEKSRLTDEGGEYQIYFKFPLHHHVKTLMPSMPLMSKRLGITTNDIIENLGTENSTK